MSEFSSAEESQAELSGVIAGTIVTYVSLSHTARVRAFIKARWCNVASTAYAKSQGEKLLSAYSLELHTKLHLKTEKFNDS